MTLSQRYLLELLISHLLSIILWQPLLVIIYPVVYKLYSFWKDPNYMNEGKFFSENEGFTAKDIQNALDKDLVTAEDSKLDKTLRSHVNGEQL